MRVYVDNVYSSNNISFENEQKFAIKTAKELMYGKSVVAELSNAKTKNDLFRILTTARQQLCD